MAGNATEGQIAALPHRPAHEGGDGRGGGRPGRDDARAGDAGRRRGRDDLLDTAGTGGGRPTFNVSTTAALIAAGAGCAVAKHGNRSATGLSRLGRRARGAGRPHRPRARRRRALHRRGRLRLHVRPGPPPATRFVVPVRKELAVRTIFNFLGPLTNPAGAPRQLIGVSDPAYLDTHGRGARAAGRRPGVGSVQRGRPGRDEHVRAARSRRGQRRRRASSATTSRPATSGCAAAPDAISGGTPEANAATTRADLRGRAGPARATSLVLNAGAAIYAAARADSLEAGVSAARGGDRRRRGRRARCERYVGATRSWPAATMSVLERIVDAHARGSRAAPARGPARRARARAGGAWRGPPVLRGARAARDVAHRRAQAALAVSAGEIREGATVTEIVEAYERGGAAALSVLTERPALRRLARRPARGARGERAADPAQGLHRRRLPGLRGRGGGRRRDAADRRRARARGARRAAPRGAWRWTSTCSSRSTTRRSSSARWSRRRRRHRHQQPRPDRLHASTSSAPTSCWPTCRRARRSSRSPASTRREQIDELERVGVDAVLVGETLMRARRHRGRLPRARPAATASPSA